MELQMNPKYPDVADLRLQSKKKVPRFAFEYLDGGCNADENLHRNRSELQAIQLMPDYLGKHTKSSMKTELFGHTYDAPFGISPVGLQGLMWPKAPQILAKAAVKHNIPFVLSTVTTASIEEIGKITEGKAWFQLYHPAEDSMRDDIMTRCENAGMDVFMALADVPSFGFRPRDIRNGLAMPPKFSLRNFLQVCKRPEWALRTLFNGQPEFETLKPYMPKGLDLKQLGAFMDKTFSGRLNVEKLKPIRDKWKGKLVVKGIVNEEDAEKCVKIGVDGIVVSNHGGRQLDIGESTITPLQRLAPKFKDKMKVMVDSGYRSGPDIARGLACGADFTFMGRSFMYGVGALGNEGGDHTISMMKRQLQQVMEQVCCEKVADFPNHLIK
ncbi:MAG: alpha-hydroxy-acid oxidizing protein [Cyclobacteriaceae bacterium]